LTTQRLLVAAMFFIAAPLVTPGNLSAQATQKQRTELSQLDSTRVISITTLDGSTFVGRVVAARAESIDLVTSAGRVTILFANMKPVTSIGVAGREDWFPNPNATRLFFAPTGQMLAKGEGYFSDYEVLFPGVAYGLTDNITVGGGVSLLPTGLDKQVWYLTPKVGASVSPRLHLAVGALVAGVPGEDPVGAVYGVGTAGDGDQSVTAGIAYGFAGSEFSSEFAVLVGGEKRVSRRIALVTENYFVPSAVGEPVVSGGIRMMSDKLTVDLALFNLVGESAFLPGIPFVSFVYKF
jgi:hypothetical protein